MTQADRGYAERIERSARAKHQADSIIENNKGDQLRAWLFAQAIMEAFEEGVMAERERQAQARHEGKMAGRGL